MYFFKLRQLPNRKIGKGNKPFTEVIQMKQVKKVQHLGNVS